ncbi:MAG: RadC family protein, partial [Deltaproteobacteria bacterium]|nr:RadC family protein [Deltaproteobacteria bacterium]
MAEADRTKAGHRKRLKERFKKTGLEGFHDYEVIELLLTYAIPRRDVKPLAKELIRRFRGFMGVLEAKKEELTSIKGIGKRAAALLLLLREIAQAYLKESPIVKTLVKRPLDAVEFIRRAHPGGAAERLLAIYLNTKNEILGVDTLHEGALEGMKVSPADVADVIGRAFRHNARSIIFVHSLPEGGVSAAEAGKGLSKAFQKAASAVDIII